MTAKALIIKPIFQNPNYWIRIKLDLKLIIKSETKFNTLANRMRRVILTSRTVGRCTHMIIDRVDVKCTCMLHDIISTVVSLWSFFVAFF